MKKQLMIIFMALLCIASMVIAGTTGKIAGKVVDAESGDPMPGVNIVIQGTQMGAATDVEGDYFILNVPPGDYTLVATMIGYETVNKTGIRVSVDRTITVNFQLKQTVIAGEEVTVVAEKEVVKKDVSASELTASVEQIEAVPLVDDVREFITIQSGIQDEEEGIMIRGGGLDQVGLVVDGLPMVNNVASQPMNIVNLSAIEEISIIKGGFNAEYGNVRSGMFNIVTKDGREKYHASVDFRYSVPHQKHRGESIFSPNNFWLRPYLDPAVAFIGTNSPDSPWNAYARRQYPEFEGWNAFSARLLADDDPTNDLTPEQARDLFIWQHRAEGSDALGHPHPGEYGEDPDLNLDVSLSGPVPVVGEMLGGMTFFASFRDNVEQYTIPAATDNFHIQNSMVKLKTNISSSMRLGIEGMYGEENNAGIQASNIGGDRGIYFPHGSAAMDIYQSMVGLTFDHVLSPSTFYQVRLSRVHSSNNMYGARTLRNTKVIRKIGAVEVDEQPWGWYPVQGYQYALADRMVLGGVGGGGRDFNKVTTWNLKVDFTSQINKYNQVQAGIDFMADDYDIWQGERGLDPTGNYTIAWEQTPLKLGAYIQDKLEFEGMVANIGLRMDWNDPNTEWFTRDPYSPYFSRVFKDQLEDEGPKEKAEGNIHFAPRIGISHPISDVSKLFFNYGHFYSLAPAFDMYEIDYGVDSQGIERLGNPSLKMPRNISYELGYEHEIAKSFLVRLTGYYKDVTNQVGSVRYVNYDESVSYDIAQNDHYADIRGFEVEIRKNYGRWITGWLNYTYMVETNGLIGREFQFQDPRRQIIEGKRNPVQEKPLPLPFARANIQLRTPQGWGPTIGNIHPLEDFIISVLGFYNAGDYLTWEPVPPYKVENNLQWKARWNFDARFSKQISVGTMDFVLFADITNIFDVKYLTNAGFEDDADHRDYMNSLHLPMYGEKKYKGDPIYTEGDDKVGDVWSEDKPYIDMPNLDYMAWNPPRSVMLGIKLNF